MDTDLRPGDSEFQVQASPDGRTWSAKGPSRGIFIAPPRWLTPRSRGGALSALAASIFGVFRWCVQAMTSREKALQKLVEQRTAELEKASDQAQTANRAKSTFLANMSHELRTPLTAILGFSSLMLEGAGVSEEQRKSLEIINSSGEHLLRLINDVLDLAKIEAGRVVLENALCDLRELVREITEMMQGHARAKNLQLLVEDSSGFPGRIRIDAARLRQILINLLANAVTYTERGAVTLRVEGLRQDFSDRVMLRFEVQDTGIGIALEHQARIFEPFVQVGRRTTQKGTGLGLTIVRQLVELMGGTVCVESAPGEGSLFRVEMPVERATEAEATTPWESGRSVVRIAPGQTEYRILVVGNIFENRLLLQLLLEGIGFHVRAAQNGAEGIEIFRSWRPRFIWIDGHVPEMDSLEAVRRIRELDGGRGVKIAGVTASVLTRDRDEMLAAGVDDVLYKPYRPGEIFNCMARHLGVRYIRIEGAAPRTGGKGTALPPDALAALPEKLRQDLTNALLGLDVERIDGVVRGIAGVDPELGGTLSLLAGKFAYTPILEALQASGEKQALAAWKPRG